MSEHKAKLQWSRDGTEFTYKTYSRNHTWRFEGGVEVPASAAPQFLGDASRVDPESALVAALSSCHLLTFLAIAANSGFVVDSYEDDPVGHLEKNANGKLAVARVILRPKIVFSGAKQPSAPELEKLHDKAHRECFIANSVLTTVTVEPAA
jgi:organic hydroperoxide reductase OsmC/OhrA